MGWPVLEASPGSAAGTGVLPAIYPDSLNQIRQHCRRFHVLHRYFVDAASSDNDFYFRIGLTQPDVNPELLEFAEAELRRHLCAAGPRYIDLTASSLFLVAYHDETLPRASSQVLAVADTQGITERELLELYAD